MVINMVKAITQQLSLPLAIIVGRLGIYFQTEVADGYSGRSCSGMGNTIMLLPQTHHEVRATLILYIYISIYVRYLHLRRSCKHLYKQLHLSFPFFLSGSIFFIIAKILYKFRRASNFLILLIKLVI